MVPQPPHTARRPQPKTPALARLPANLDQHQAVLLSLLQNNIQWRLQRQPVYPAHLSQADDYAPVKQHAHIPSNLKPFVQRDLLITSCKHHEPLQVSV